MLLRRQKYNLGVDMNDNEVSLYIGGSVFKNWTSFSITNELNIFSPAFSVGVVPNSNLLNRKN